MERVSGMRYTTAVSHLRAVAESCDRWSSVQEGMTEARLTAAYAYGPVLEIPKADLDLVHIALVIDLPAEELPWGAEPRRWPLPREPPLGRRQRLP
jgi:hypothetical protein